MKLTEREIELLSSIANTESGEALVKYYEKIISDVTDIRNPLSVPPELQIPTRMALAEILREKLIIKFKLLSGTINEEKEEFI